MPHAIEMKDGKTLTPFGIRDLLEAVSDYGTEPRYGIEHKRVRLQEGGSRDGHKAQAR